MLRTPQLRRDARGPRPGSARLRLTLAATAVAAVLLTLAAVACAVAVRNSLVASVVQVVTDGTSVELVESPPGDDTSYVETPLDEYTGRRDRLPLIHGERLSLWPWTDPGDATPAELIEADGTSLWLAREDSGPYPDAWTDQQRLNTTVGWLAGGTLGLTMLTAGGTWLVIGRALKPVDDIRTQFAALSLSRLDQRIPAPRGGREFKQLVATMNSVLDRLDAAAARQRQFTSDVAHELRTPLACLRAELELALTSSGAAHWLDAARDSLHDTLQLQDITTNLLLLARLDAHASHSRTLLTEQVDVADLIRDDVARRDVPDHLSLAVTAPDEPAPVTGHRGLLARVLANLLDNAERHAATRITVTLALDHERRQAVVDVANDGPPVPPEHQETIFERFSRLDDARTRDAGGHRPRPGHRPPHHRTPPRHPHPRPQSARPGGRPVHRTTAPHPRGRPAAGHRTPARLGPARGHPCAPHPQRRRSAPRRRRARPGTCPHHSRTRPPPPRTAPPRRTAGTRLGSHRPRRHPPGRRYACSRRRTARRPHGTAQAHVGETTTAFC